MRLSFFGAAIFQFWNKRRQVALLLPFRRHLCKQRKTREKEYSTFERIKAFEFPVDTHECGYPKG